MSLFDGIAQALETQAAAAVAAKMGIDPALAQTALSALTQNHVIPGNTVDQSAQQTGLSPNMLSEIVSHIGGENGLGALVGALGAAAPQGGGATAPAGNLSGILADLGSVASMLDRDGDGNPLNDVAGMLGKT